MKKLITLTVLSFITMVVFAQTPLVTPSYDTAFVVFKQATLKKSTFVTTSNSALYTPEVFNPAGYSVTFKAFKGTITPPVTQPPVVIPPVISGAAVPLYPSKGVFSSASSISLSGVNGQVISGKDITNTNGDCIKLVNCQNITVISCNLHDAKGYGVNMLGCKNITIIQNNFTNVIAGVNHQDSPSDGGGVVINYNRYHNMHGPIPKGQYVQFNNVRGAGLSVSFNRGDNVSGQSQPEDCINMFNSFGTATSPIQIVGNWIYGGGPSKSGGGIMLGDNGGDYQYASGNILVNPGQYGMAIAGGGHNTITGNQIYAMQQSFTNIAVYVWDNGDGFTITNAVISNNLATFWAGTGAAAGGLNGYWDADGTATNVNNNWNAGLTSAILPPVNTW